jgi:hypothetical protein
VLGDPDRRHVQVPELVGPRDAAAVLAAAVSIAAGYPAAAAPRANAAASCADYPDQAAAQRAADTRDPDGDGILCVIYSR